MIKMVYKLVYLLICELLGKIMWITLHHNTTKVNIGDKAPKIAQPPHPYPFGQPSPYLSVIFHFSFPHSSSFDSFSSPKINPLWITNFQAQVVHYLRALLEFFFCSSFELHLSISCFKNTKVEI